MREGAFALQSLNRHGPATIRGLSTSGRDRGICGRKGADIELDVPRLSLVEAAEVHYAGINRTVIEYNLFAMTS